MDEFPCGNYNKSTSGSADLQCSICEIWHRRGCVTGMTKEAHQQVVSMKTMGYIFFLCGKCEKVHKKVWKAVNYLEKRADSVESRQEEVEKMRKIRKNAVRKLQLSHPGRRHQLLMSKKQSSVSYNNRKIVKLILLSTISLGLKRALIERTTILVK